MQLCRSMDSVTASGYSNVWMIFIKHLGSM